MNIRTHGEEGEASRPNTQTYICTRTRAHVHTYIHTRQRCEGQVSTPWSLAGWKVVVTLGVGAASRCVLQVCPAPPLRISRHSPQDVAKGQLLVTVEHRACDSGSCLHAISVSLGDTHVQLRDSGSLRNQSTCLPGLLLPVALGTVAQALVAS